MYKPQIESQQIFCSANHYECLVTSGEQIVGLALDTLGRCPINGLRHNPMGETSGWYIWCGEEFSSSSDFFSPLHAKHLQDRLPEVYELLGLSPGYRFLKAEDYLDVWFDDSLLLEDESE